MLIAGGAPNATERCSQAPGIFGGQVRLLGQLHCRCLAISQFCSQGNLSKNGRLLASLEGRCEADWIAGALQSSQFCNQGDSSKNGRQPLNIFGGQVRLINRIAWPM